MRLLQVRWITVVLLAACTLLLLACGWQEAAAARLQGGAPVYVPTDVRVSVVDPSTGQDLGAPPSNIAGSGWILKVTVSLDRYVEVPGSTPATTSFVLEGNSVPKFQYMGQSWSSTTLAPLPATITVPNQRGIVVRYLYVSPVVSSTSGQYVKARHSSQPASATSQTLTVVPAHLAPPLPPGQDALRPLRSAFRTVFWM